MTPPAAHGWDAGDYYTASREARQAWERTDSQLVFALDEQPVPHEDTVLPSGLLVERDATLTAGEGSAIDGLSRTGRAGSAFRTRADDQASPAVSVGALKSGEVTRADPPSGLASGESMNGCGLPRLERAHHSPAGNPLPGGRAPTPERSHIVSTVEEKIASALSADRVDTINAARIALADIASETRNQAWNASSSIRDDGPYAQDLGRVSGLAEAAEETLFHVLNVARAYNVAPLTDEQLHIRGERS